MIFRTNAAQLGLKMVAVAKITIKGHFYYSVFTCLHSRSEQIGPAENCQKEC